MKFTEKELGHLVFLAEVVLEGRKKELMPEMMQCLLYVAKSIREAEFPQETAEQIRDMMERMEQALKGENDRLREIRGNLQRRSRH